MAGYSRCDAAVGVRVGQFDWQLESHCLMAIDKIIRQPPEELHDNIYNQLSINGIIWKVERNSNIQYQNRRQHCMHVSTAFR